jgi:8-oxo-dGTP diphosphatase
LKRLYPDQPVVGVGAVIIKDRQLLLIKRANEPSRGKWTIPGGLVELAESPEIAVIRETVEETGMEVTNPQLIDVISNVDIDEWGKVKYHYVIIDYLVHVVSGNGQASSDAQELCFVPFGEVESFDLTSSFRLFFRNNRARLENADSYQ